MPGGSNFPPPGMLPVRHHQNDDMSYMFFLVRESLKKSFICDDCPPSSVFQISQRNASKWQKHPAGSLNSPRTWAGCRSATNVGDAQKLDINPHPNPPITESVGDYKSTLKGERYLTKKKRNIRHKSEVPWWYDVGIVFFLRLWCWFLFHCSDRWDLCFLGWPKLRSSRASRAPISVFRWWQVNFDGDGGKNYSL